MSHRSVLDVSDLVRPTLRESYATTCAATYMSPRHMLISVSDGIKQISLDAKSTAGEIVIQRAKNPCEAQSRMTPSSSGSIWIADRKFEARCQLTPSVGVCQSSVSRRHTERCTTSTFRYPLGGSFRFASDLHEHHWAREAIPGGWR